MRGELCSLHNGKNATFAYNMAYSLSWHPKSDKVNRQIGVRDFKIVDHFCPRFGDRSRDTAHAQ